MAKKTPVSEVAEKVRGKVEEEVITSEPKEEKVEAPVIPAKKEETVIPTPTKKSTDDIHVGYMDNYIEQYLAVNDGYLDTDMKISLAIAKFKQLILFAIDNPTPAVLEKLLDFFKKNRSRVLAEELALQGITKLPADLQMRLSIVYRLFYDYTTPVEPGKKKSYKPNLDMVRDILKDDRLVNFCAERFS